MVPATASVPGWEQKDGCSEAPDPAGQAQSCQEHEVCMKPARKKEILLYHLTWLRKPASTAPAGDAYLLAPKI